jgi:DNA-binding NarL/FixJ family response regulator
LFLLDLTLPVTDGFEVLRWVRSQPHLKDIPVVVLTASDRIRDVNQAYQLGAHSFLVKSLDFQDAIALAQSISDYWLKIKKHTPAQLLHSNGLPKRTLSLLRLPQSIPNLPQIVLKSRPDWAETSSQSPKTPPEVRHFLLGRRLRRENRRVQGGNRRSQVQNTQNI